MDLLMTMMVCVGFGLVVGQGIPDSFKRKYERLFDYRNLVKETTPGEEVLNTLDYNEMKERLSGHPMFSPVASKIAEHHYIWPEGIIKGTAYTRGQFIQIMEKDRQDRLLGPKYAELIYEELVSAQDPQGGELERDTLVAYETAIGSMNANEANEYIDQMTTGDTISKDTYSWWYEQYMNNQFLEFHMFGGGN